MAGGVVPAQESEHRAGRRTVAVEEGAEGQSEGLLARSNAPRALVEVEAGWRG